MPKNIKSLFFHYVIIFFYSTHGERIYPIKIKIVDSTSTSSNSLSSLTGGLIQAEVVLGDQSPF
jgi:hypothetical protein